MRQWVLLAFSPAACLAQPVLKGHVVDGVTHEALAYCSIALQGRPSGTLSNDEGAFALPFAIPEDTILFTMIGYERRALSVSDALRSPEVALTSAATDLAPVEVRPDQDELYELVARCARKMLQLTEVNSKLYFEMGTRMDDQPVEVVESFYNARVRGPHIEQLDLKHGRIGIAPVGDRFFVNLDVTKAMSMLDIREADERFPTSPFQWTTAKALRKRYHVQERGRREKDPGPVHVLLTPRDTSGSGFVVDAWIRAGTSLPEAIVMSCEHCVRYPFVPLEPEDRIRRIDMRVSISFREDPETRAELDHMELDYRMDHTGLGREHAVHTTATMRTFDRDRLFILPLFAYDARQNDYRKITFQPYDSSFWATAPTLVRTEQQERDRDFFAQHGFLTGNARPRAFSMHTFFESNYAFWAPDRRISLKTLPPRGEASVFHDRARAHRTVQPPTVHLEAQLYMDVDTTGDRPRIFTATVFDGFRSYHEEPEQRYTDAYLNIFFDLCEMERRRLDDEVRVPGLTYADMCAAHSRAVRRMHVTTAQYDRQVVLGANGPAFARWNQVVKDALGIDNFVLDGLDPEGKSR